MSARSFVFDDARIPADAKKNHSKQILSAKEERSGRVPDPKKYG